MNNFSFYIGNTLPTEICQSWETSCENGGCIPSSFVCDGDADCSSGEDEWNCSGM